MSLWERLRGRFGAPRGTAPVTDGPDAVVGAAGREAAASNDARAVARLEAMARGARPFDEGAAVVALDEAVAEGDEARGLEAAVRLSGAHAEAARLGLRVAELRASRGDDAGAWATLEPWLGASSASLRLLEVAGEVAERLGRAADARRLYETVVSRDASSAAARRGLARLAARDAPLPPAFATLMSEARPGSERYHVEAELGRGGAGTVFVAVDTRLDRRVALKVYHRRGGGFDPRLRTEASTPAALEHPGVIRVFDLDDVRGAIAMEWVEGGALRDRITSGALSLVEACRFAASAVDALAFVHARGVVHRDLKPSNILLRSDGRAVLTDFGLALPVGQAPSGEGAAGEGTLRYMPPEQRAGGPARVESDVHALGVTLGELVGSTREAAPPELLELFAACARTAPGDRPRLVDLQRALALHGGLA